MKFFSKIGTSQIIDRILTYRMSRSLLHWLTDASLNNFNIHFLFFFSQLAWLYGSKYILGIRIYLLSNGSTLISLFLSCLFKQACDFIFISLLINFKMQFQVPVSIRVSYHDVQMFVRILNKSKQQISSAMEGRQIQKQALEHDMEESVNSEFLLKAHSKVWDNFWHLKAL